jgi:MFS superfamily sulfate permease-like transporter
MEIPRKARFYFLSFLKHDFKASITVFFVALPLCLGISLASNASSYSGLIAGIIGGVVISLISSSQLSVSGPAAGLTAISAAVIAGTGTPGLFFLSVAAAGILQIILGICKLGGFTHFIPSAVIKGMLSAIGVLLISKQVPILIGYDKPDFWTNEFFNIVTFNHAWSHIGDLYANTSRGALLLSVITFFILFGWKKYISKKVSYIPASFITVITGILIAHAFNKYFPAFALRKSLFVNVPENIFSLIQFPDLKDFIGNFIIWKHALIICFVASLETLLSIVAIDKLDPYNRVSPQNRELIAQGTGNFLSGLAGGLPITAVIVRSSANAEAGAHTKMSSIFHGIWLAAALLFAIPFLNSIPYCVLGVILLRTGYNLVKPHMVKMVFKQGKEQFFPFIVTVIAILFTDLLIGVLIGIVYAIYFLVKHTYYAGFIMRESMQGSVRIYQIDLALNVSFLNKKKFINMLDKIPPYSVVEINGTNSIYIDYDILEIFHDYKAKAKHKHVELVLKNIPNVETIEVH